METLRNLCILNRKGHRLWLIDFKCNYLGDVANLCYTDRLKMCGSEVSTDADFSLVTPHDGHGESGSSKSDGASDE